MHRLPESGSLSIVDYDWDDAKNALNRRKHGVDFMDAIAALEDPNRVEDIDTQLEYGEERINTIARPSAESSLSS